jgi:hypothetical protein
LASEKLIAFFHFGSPNHRNDATPSGRKDGPSQGQKVDFSKEKVVAIGSVSEREEQWQRLNRQRPGSILQR